MFARFLSPFQLMTREKSSLPMALARLLFFFPHFQAAMIQAALFKG